jgi:hypothetical protein
MSIKNAIIVSGLETFADYLGKHLDQTRDRLRLFGEDEEMRATYQQEFAQRVELRNYVRELINELEEHGFIDTDTPENRRLLNTLENL